MITGRELVIWVGDDHPDAEQYNFLCRTGSVENYSTCRATRQNVIKCTFECSHIDDLGKGPLKLKRGVRERQLWMQDYECPPLKGTS